MIYQAKVKPLPPSSVSHRHSSHLQHWHVRPHLYQLNILSTTRSLLSLSLSSTYPPFLSSSHLSICASLQRSWPKLKDLFSFSFKMLFSASFWKFELYFVLTLTLRGVKRDQPKPFSAEMNIKHLRCEIECGFTALRNAKPAVLKW